MIIKKAGIMAAADVYGYFLAGELVYYRQALESAT
jgi:hypothetical protein